MLVHWIWLTTRSGMNDRTRLAVLEHFGDAEDVYCAGGESLRQVEMLTEEGFQALCDKDLRPAQKILAQCADGDIRILTYHDSLYPNRLKHISDPPLVLYYKGTLPNLDELPVIGVVGTRRGSTYGLNAARRMGYQIGKCGGVIVSGLAAGIDTMAMKGALAAQSTVIGVLGCGADVVYPASSRELYAQTQRSGCIITEYPPETPPAKWNFPRRNRIISGLCCGVLVVEAPERSGALITARQAAEQGRDVFVVPGNIDVTSCQGSNALLRDGGAAVSSGWDVMQEYEHQYPDVIRRFDGSLQIAIPEPEREKEELKVAQITKIPTSKPRKKKKDIDNGVSSPYIDVEKPVPKLSAEEQAVVACLRGGKRLADDVITELGNSAGQILATLTILEVKGFVRRLPGNMLELK